MRDVVLARAYRGEPLMRIVMGTGERLIYLANEQEIGAVEQGLSDAVGFPAEDVFVFDPQLFSRLTNEWQATGQTTRQAWESAIPWTHNFPARRVRTLPA